MPLNPTYRLAPPLLDADRNTLLSLQDLAGYEPHNRDFSVSNLQALDLALTQAEQAEQRARVALETARDRAIEAGHAFHNATLGAKAEVIARYGVDSLEVQAIGLKRKSERRRPVRRPQLGV